MNNNIQNSYFITATDDRFDKAVEVAGKPLRNLSSEIDWKYPKNNHLDLHCTIFYSTNNTAIAPSLGKISAAFNNAITILPFQEMLRLQSCEILSRGSVVLKFAPNKKMESLHKKLLLNFQNEELTPSVYSLNNFLIHVTIGELKKSGNKAKALTELNQVFANVKNTKVPFCPDTLLLKNGNTVLAKASIPKMDVGIRVVQPNGNSYHLVCFSDVNKAQNFAKKIFEFHEIENYAAPGNPKIVKSSGQTHTIRLDQQQYDAIKSYYKNM